VIHVERGWDQCEGEVPPKSKQGRRRVPIPAALRDRLAEYLIDGPAAGRIFVGVRDSYERGSVGAHGVGVEPPTLHECRHGYAALMIAAGVNVKALSVFMGHANIRITLDEYGHLLPGAEDEAAGLLDAFLARQFGRGRNRADCTVDCTAPRVIPPVERDRLHVLHLTGFPSDRWIPPHTGHLDLPRTRIDPPARQSTVAQTVAQKGVRRAAASRLSVGTQEP
jgi:hypothetical protein